MEKRAGWGAEYPADLRNGEWEFSMFKPDRTFNDKANINACRRGGSAAQCQIPT